MKGFRPILPKWFDLSKFKAFPKSQQTREQRKMKRKYLNIKACNHHGYNCEKYGCTRVNTRKGCQAKRGVVLGREKLGN